MRRHAPAALWVLLLVVLAVVATRQWRLDTGLNAFTAPGQGLVQSVLVDELRSGGIANVLLVRVDGGEDGAAGRLGRALRALPDVAVAAAGPRGELLGDQSLLFRYRYLLSDRVTEGLFTQPRLRSALEDLIAALRRPVPTVSEARAAADPTGELSYLTRQWLGGARLAGGGWRTASGAGVVLVLPRAAPYELDDQARLIDRIRSTAAERVPGATVTIAGAPAIAVAVREAVHADVRWIAWMAGLGVGSLLILALRRARALVYVVLPVVTGAVAATAMVLLVFGRIHGITLGFGGIVLGVTVDYPLHLLGRARAHGQGLPEAFRAVRRPLLVSALSTALGLLVMLLSGVAGLRQIALFAAVGIAAALVTTAVLLPRLPWVSPARAAPVEGRVLPTRRASARGAAAVCLVCVGGGAWGLSQVDLGSDLTDLSPLPAGIVELDGELREALALPEPRHLIALHGPEAATLSATERVTSKLGRLRRDGVLDRYSAVTDVIPAPTTQRQRRQYLPTPAELRQRLKVAAEGLPIDVSALEPFVRDVQASRDLPWLRPARVDSGLLGRWLSGLFRQHGEDWLSLVRLSDVGNFAAVAGMARNSGGQAVRVAPIDVRAETEAMVSAYQRAAVSYSLIGAALMLVLLVAGTGSAVRSARAVLVIAAGLGAAFMLLGLLREPLTLFHLCSVLLIAGLALDYALFTSHGDGGVYSSGLCAASSVIAFGALATADTPVLHGIGVTVVAGVAASWVVACLLHVGHAGRQRERTPCRE